MELSLLVCLLRHIKRTSGHPPPNSGAVSGRSKGSVSCEASVHRHTSEFGKTGIQVNLAAKSAVEY